MEEEKYNTKEFESKYLKNLAQQNDSDDEYDDYLDQLEQSAG